MKGRIKNIPEYSGIGVYALVDENGKRYIGSSKNVQRRIKQHNTHMNVFFRDGHSGFLNPKIEQALSSGAVFSCEVLCEIHSDVSKYELEEIERIFLNKYGGYDECYNFIPIKHRV